MTEDYTSSRDPAPSARDATQLQSPRFAVLAALDFEPEDRPEKMIEATFLADAETEWVAGLYELRFIRPLTRAEWKAREYRQIIAKETAPDQSAQRQLSDAAQVELEGSRDDPS